ncbi:MAG: hypothetical protein OXR67_04370 [Chloroflexota bacterium]|nr:hypothetical protein [Chloroflexota bacterium]
MTFHSFLHPAWALPLAFPLVLCLLLITLALHSGTTVSAQGSETVKVEGVAINGTEGSPIPASFPVSLHTIDPVAGRVATYNATTDSQGRFAFEEVSTVAGGSYVLVMDYEGMRYSELLESDDLSDPVEFAVFDITGDIGVVRVQRQAMIIADVDEQNREIQALEVLSLQNGSDRTLLPELTNITNPADINFLRFSLPAGATELSVQSSLPGGDTIPMGTGFAVTAPVPPGDHEVTYTYRFPYEGDAATFNQRLIQGAEEYQVLAPASLSQMQVSPLEPRPRVDVGGVSYLVWEAEQVPPGQGVVLHFSRLPQPTLTQRVVTYVTSLELWLTTIPVVLALALVALLLWAWFRAPRSGRRALVVDTVGQSRRQSLVQAVAVLDERYEGGRVADEEYGPRRQELLEQLRQLTPPAGG